MLSIRTFGPLGAFVDGEALPLPASRKTRALLGYLCHYGNPAAARPAMRNVLGGSGRSARGPSLVAQ